MEKHKGRDFFKGLERNLQEGIFVGFKRGLGGNFNRKFERMKICNTLKSFFPEDWFVSPEI